MKHTKEQLLEAYNKLPKSLQEAVLSVDTTKAISEIGKKYGLPVDKMGELADQTTGVMLGFTDSKDLISNLKTNLNVDIETAQKIGEDVNSKIFLPIREALMSLRSDTEEENKEAPAEVTKEEVLKEIERNEPPAIFKGTVVPKESPFDAKMSSHSLGGEKSVFKIPPEESEIKEGEDAKKTPPPKDPYREPID